MTWNPDSAGLLKVLSDSGLVPEPKLASLQTHFAKDWQSAAEILLSQSGLEEADLIRVIGGYLGIPVVDSLAGAAVPDEFFELVAPEYARQAGIAARSITDGQMDLVVALGADMAAIVSELGLASGRDVVWSLAPRSEIESFLDRSVRQRPEYLEHAVGELGSDGDIAEAAVQVEHVTDFAELMRKTPVVKLVSLLVAQAVRTGASDIHVQPLGDSLRIRFRTDGILHDILDLPRASQEAIISRIKVLGKMDIAERRAPQDGRASFRYADRDIDVRISVIPTSEGERAVLRLLDKQAKLLQMEDLGLDAENLRRFDRLIHSTHGMLLVTGPTGSGKTTTLYSALGRINSPKVNIITIEDPVEYKISGISQVQVLAKKNVTFGSMLRSVVRQDPNIIMIGEIRDAETASIAVQSSLTGHLMFSTLHTNDSAGAIARLLDLGVEPFLLASALLATLAQRLVRCVCPHCGAPDDSPLAEMDRLGITPEMLRSGKRRKGTGCSECLNAGYLGRIGIFELLVVDDAIRRLINSRASSSLIRDEAVRAGLRVLRADGADKVLAGITTADEVLRVTQRDAD